MIYMADKLMKHMNKGERDAANVHTINAKECERYSKKLWNYENIDETISGE